MRAQLSFTPLFRFLRDIARVKNWPRATSGCGLKTF
jgi:hypothetical protein